MSIAPGPLADRVWRWRHSAWLLAPVLGFGLLSFVGFVYLGVRDRTRWAWTAAVVGSLGSALTWAASLWTEPATGHLTDAGAACVLGLWVALIAYGAVINRAHLRHRAAMATARPWYADPAMPTPMPSRPAPPTDLTRPLTALVERAQIDPALPSDALAAVERIGARLDELVRRTDQTATDAVDRDLLARIITDYLPSSLNAYVALPAGYAMTAPTAGGRTPHAELMHQLGLLEREVADIATAVYAGDTARLQAQGRFLEDRFRRSELDLP